ncbi:MAG: hypothetical protein CMJ75_17715 [Planctomycetaceae bacterium]|nr:hypothetical protein [Planctomycetaceae bacterium]
MSWNDLTPHTQAIGRVIARVPLLGLWVAWGLTPVSADEGDFYRDVQAALVKSCILCHGPSKQESGYRVDLLDVLLRGGESGQPAVIPGNPEASYLWQRIVSQDPDQKMPPRGSGLDASERARLRTWIASGAELPQRAQPSNPRTDHWAFNRIAQPAVPAVIPFQGQLNPVDAFIDRSLAASGLMRSVEASRRQLIRRVYLVTLGLPPEPGQVAAFVDDRRPDAYARMIDGVLASPRYGERWAQHWLDCVRYAETTGYEVNGPNGKIYPYRDYLINALNEDRAYDRMILEQIAGDQFGMDAATGFLVAGPHDTNRSPDPRLTAMQYQDGLDEIIKSTSAVFLGITLGCARCHDHKYDPFAQADYYAMQAVFAGTSYGSRRQQGAENERMAKSAKLLKPQLATLRQQLATLRERYGLKPPVDFHAYEETFAPVVTAAVQLRIHAANDQGIVELDDVEVWTTPGPAGESTNVAHRDLGARAVSSPTAKANQGKTADLLLDGTRQLFLFFRSVDKENVWITIYFDRPYLVDRIVIKPRGAHVPVDYRIDVAVGDQWREVVDSRGRMLHPQDMRPANRVQLTGVARQATARLVATNAETRRIEAEYNRLRDGPQIFAGRFAPPQQTHLMVRGDPLVKGPPVAPAAPALFAGGELDFATPEAERRLHLARVIASPANPLTARVMVNRVWQYIFGAGIVDTPSDFGINGGRPSHPVLLDWLAIRFMEEQWSIKRLQRRLLSSATFRQASFSRREAAQIDAGCRLLWRFPPRRLSAEAIRDSLLLVSGRLNRRMGGPSFSFFEQATSVFEKKQPRGTFGPEGWRRMIYGEKLRLEYVGVFGVFDCPDASQMAPKRTVSTSAGQALSLLNSVFVARQAESLGDIARRQAAGLREQVTVAARRALCRPLHREEMSVLLEVAEQQGLVQVCRILLNLNEFVFVQ